MKSQVHNTYEKLFEVAEGQQGFFTAKQAVEAGYIATNHPYHVQAGNWVREGRGIYRLRNFPQSPDSQLITHAFWTRNRQDEPEGVYSHETALAIHELSDVMPSKLHMTVPRDFRRFAQPPKVLTLHFAKLNQADIEEKRGFKVTRPFRTIMDILISESIPYEVVKQAFDEARRRGIIAQAEFASERLPENVRTTFEKLSKRTRGHSRKAS